MNKSDCRQKIGWEPNQKIVLFNARNDPIGKRLDLAEAAFAHARRHVPNMRLHVFRGTTAPDEMPTFYNAADCLLMTSAYEGSPMVIKESLACSLPVVAVDVGDVAERLNGVTPSAVVARNPVALGDALVDILRLNQRSNGRTAIAPLSEESIAGRLVEIYYKAASRTHDNRHQNLDVAPSSMSHADAA
jgi:hypothetical protein